MHKLDEKGALSGYLIPFIVSIVLFLSATGFGVWSYLGRQDYKTNVDKKIATAVEIAIKQTSTDKDNEFVQREKKPLKSYHGPEEYGSLDVKYPKTWSVYVASDGIKSGGYQAYLHPGGVPPTATGSNKFALQVSIVSQAYDQVLQQYSGQVKQGALRSSAITANGFNAQRFDGKISKDVDGSVVVFKIRDKTLILKTDSTAFVPDFDDKIIKTINFDL